MLPILLLALGAIGSTVGAALIAGPWGLIVGSLWVAWLGYDLSTPDGRSR